MPRINILKVDRPVCEDCGKKIENITYCHIETATGKEIKMHRECAVDFALSILEEFSKDKEFREKVKRDIENLYEKAYHLKDTTSEVEEEITHYNIMSYEKCRGCFALMSSVVKEDKQYWCTREYCVQRDGER